MEEFSIIQDTSSILDNNNMLDNTVQQQLCQELLKENTNKNFRYKKQYIDLLSKMNYNNLLQQTIIKNTIYANTYVETLAKFIQFDKIYLINFEFYNIPSKTKNTGKNFIERLQQDIQHIIEVNDIQKAYQLIEQFYTKQEVNILNNIRINNINIDNKLTNKEKAKLNSIINNLQKKEYTAFNLNTQNQLKKLSKDNNISVLDTIIPCYIQVYDCLEHTYNYYTLISQEDFKIKANVIKHNQPNVLVTYFAENINYIQDFYTKAKPFKVFEDQNINKNILVLHINLSSYDLHLYDIYFSKLLIQIIPLLTSRINVKGLLYEVSLHNTVLPQQQYYKTEGSYCLINTEVIDEIADELQQSQVRVSQQQLDDYDKLIQIPNKRCYFKFINNNRKEIGITYKKLLRKMQKYFND